MAILGIYIVTQMSLIYANSAYSGVSPLTVSAYEFVQAQEVQSGLEWYSFLNMKTVFIELGVFFLIDGFLLYTSIFFLVSIMNDLGQ